MTADAKTKKSGIKETLEQILIAFIFAFIFRAFIVEAFVIPTGSMAPTLLGAHMDFRCPDCGYRWAVDFPNATVQGDNVTIPDTATGDTFGVRCPNCGFKVPRDLPGDPLNDAREPQVNFGDRILVQKYSYLLNPPQRWDVVVFKAPPLEMTGPGTPRPMPDQYNQNYIKRLVGLPGDTLMILNGDVYVSRADKPLEELEPEDFRIATKPAAAQRAMWRIVYDNDFLPRGLPRIYLDPTRRDARGNPRVEVAEQPWQQPWTLVDGGGWDTAGRVFRFEGDSGTLRFDEQLNPERRPLKDWLAYDVLRGAGRGDNFRYDGYRSIDDVLIYVSDIRLAMTYRRRSGTGPLELSTTKSGRQFVVRIEVDRVSLHVRPIPSPQQPHEPLTQLGEASTHGIGGRAGSRLELLSVDHRVSLLVDGREVLATTPGQFAPDVRRLLADHFARVDQPPPTIQIRATDQSAELAHLTLWRDVTYINRGDARLRWGMPARLHLDRSDPTRRPVDTLMRLGPGEFWTLGDNSLMSFDGRGWADPIDLRASQDLYVDAGKVPERFMLGRAFFVYWPAGFRPGFGLWPILPNFGEMRFIH